MTQGSAPLIAEIMLPYMGCQQAPGEGDKIGSRERCRVSGSSQVRRGGQLPYPHPRPLLLHFVHFDDH